MERHLEARHSAPAGRASPSSRQQGSSSRSWNRSSSPRRGSQQRGLGRLSRPAARLSRPPRARSSRPAARLSRPAARRGGAAPGRRGAAIARPCPPRGVGTAARRTDQPTPQGAPLMHVRHLPTYPSYYAACASRAHLRQRRSTAGKRRGTSIRGRPPARIAQLLVVSGSAAERSSPRCGAVRRGVVACKGDLAATGRCWGEQHKQPLVLSGGGGGGGGGGSGAGLTWRWCGAGAGAGAGLVLVAGWRWRWRGSPLVQPPLAQWRRCGWSLRGRFHRTPTRAAARRES